MIKLSATSPFRSRRFQLLIAIRVCFGILALILAEPLIHFGTEISFLGLCVAVGTVASSALAFTRLRISGAVAAVLCCGALGALGISAATAFAPLTSEAVFAPYTTSLHLSLGFLMAALAFFATWGFWRTPHWLTAEIIAIGGSTVLLLAGHRDYRFDTIRAVNSLAWELNVTELAAVTIIGASITALLAAYLLLATLPGVPVPAVLPQRHRVSGRPRALQTALVLLLAGGALAGIAQQLFESRAITAAARIANGVGQQAQEGLSPLGFHSALGATNQPSALVRLNADYQENPFSPMLYLREQALSEFNGHEMVIAPKLFDTDVAGTTPFEPYDNPAPASTTHRKEIPHEVYLLTDHKIAFGIDFPMTITPLKNPNPSRFRGAYKVLSQAPSFPIASLDSLEVGDLSWPDWLREHYLKRHTDPRYAELARTIVGNQSVSPATRARLLTEYLSAKTIYTLKPNHDVPPDADQTAPYLFGDMRGYCVHFAHAMTYMLRGLGIPARVGTGYLTDLSQSKDGHILLRMSDRHAWSEVYIRDYGWIPYDVQPQQVESHGESPVDMKLLEELMGQLDPSEEILPKPSAEKEPGLREQQWWQQLTFDPQWLLWLLGAVTVTGVVTKGYLRLSVILPGNAATQARRGYRYAMAALWDLGIQRSSGETREEFAQRVARQAQLDISASTRLLNELRFNPSPQVSATTAAAALTQVQGQLRRLPLLRQLRALLSPSSVVSFLSGGRW